MLIEQLLSQPLVFLAWAAAFVFIITIHEFAHALAAFLQGDHTAKNEGRLTFNPLAHLDLVGTITLLFIGFGWGKPVPFNPHNLKNKKWGPALVAIAGPMSNLLGFVAIVIIYKILAGMLLLEPGNLLFDFLIILAYLNLTLMIFNLIPIPPLDGSKLFDALVPDRYYEFKQKVQLYGPTVLLVLVAIDIMGGISVFGWLQDIVTFMIDRVMF